VDFYQVAEKHDLPQNPELNWTSPHTGTTGDRKDTLDSLAWLVPKISVLSGNQTVLTGFHQLRGWMRKPEKSRSRMIKMHSIYWVISLWHICWCSPVFGKACVKATERIVTVALLKWRSGFIEDALSIFSCKYGQIKSKVDDVSQPPY